MRSLRPFPIVCLAILFAILPSRSAVDFTESIVDCVYPVNPWGKTVGDLNGDGFPDPALSTAYNNKIYPYAYPDWTRTILSGGNGGDDLVAVYMDGDGDLDGRPDIFIASSYSAQRLSGFEGPDNPAISPWVKHIVGSPVGYVHRFHLTDMDGDGAWESQNISTRLGSHNIAMGDIGRDGDQDIFGVNWRGDTRPRLWMNEGPSDSVPPPLEDTVQPPPPPQDTAHQVPPFDSWSDSIEAENSFLSGPIIGNSFQGYSGTGFVEYQGESNDFLEWTVNVRDAGEYILEFRYYLSDNQARPLEISVNGVVAQARWAFPGTGGWSIWSTVKMALTLPAGEVKIRAKAIGLSGPNVDRLWLDPL